jgi:hypothetical protein
MKSSIERAFRSGAPFFRSGLGAGSVGPPIHFPGQGSRAGSAVAGSLSCLSSRFGSHFQHVNIPCGIPAAGPNRRLFLRQ